MLEINSLSQLKEKLQENERSALLLYKAGSKSSDCAYKAYSDTNAGDLSIGLLVANVADVRDIHPEYSISTVPVLITFNGTKPEKIVKGCQDTAFYNSLIQDKIFNNPTSDTEGFNKRVVVYSTPTCTWCNTLKRYFDEHGVRYSDVDVSSNQKKAEEMVRRSGQQGVPQTDINGTIVVGFDKDKINRLLEIQ
jgi:glutaredoxin-like YruB-family protein